MTTNDPKVQAILVTCKSKDGETALMRAVRLVENHDPSCVNDDWDYESLIRLSDYKAMQAEYEEELFQVRQTRDSHFDMLVKSVKQVVALQDECEQLRKDAERYRWLRDTLHNAKAGGGVEVNDALQVYDTPVQGEEVRVYWYPDTPVGFYQIEATTLDGAIDEAMQGDNQ